MVNTPEKGCHIRLLDRDWEFQVQFFESKANQTINFHYGVRMLHMPEEMTEKLGSTIRKFCKEAPLFECISPRENEKRRRKEA